MAIIADVELEAGFQVVIRWYAIAARRYPLDENDYYETTFETLQPNAQFELVDPRFNLAEINEEVDNIEYVIRDICHVQSLAPEYVGFDYVQPDYTEVSLLTQDYVANDITVHVADASLFGLTEQIQIGTNPTNVSNIMSINTAENILVLTAGVPKSVIVGQQGFVAHANIVAGYPDSTAQTMIARVLDNDGNLNTEPLVVTTPIYFDSTESPKRYFVDSSLETLYNGARGSGDTVDQIIEWPLGSGNMIRAGWWGIGQVDNDPADTAALITNGGVVLATRSSQHAFEITLTYGGSEAVACTGGVTDQYFANHSRFRTAGEEPGVTSFVTTESGTPPAGFYAWTSNLGDRVTLNGFTGDDRIFNGTYFIAATTPTFDTGFDPDDTESNTVAGSLVYQKGDYYIWNRFDTQPNQGGWHVSTTNPADRWAFSASTATPQTEQLADLTTWFSNIGDAPGTPTAITDTIQVVIQAGDAGGRFVRYWDGEQFLNDVVAPGLEAPCPLDLPNSQVIRTFDNEDLMACSVEGDGVEQTVYYETFDGTFSAGQVTAIYTDPLGRSSAMPSDIGATFIQVGSFDPDGTFVGTKYVWNGSTLVESVAVCNMLRYCNDPAAVNTESIPGGIIDNSLCQYADPICTNIGASNYLEPAQRTMPPYTELTTAPTCTFPTYTAETDTTNAIIGPPEGYTITEDSFTGLNGSTYSLCATLELTPGFEWVSGPLASTSDVNGTVISNYKLQYDFNLNGSAVINAMGQIITPLPADGSTIAMHVGTFTGEVRRSAGLLTAMYDETINIDGPMVGWSFNEVTDSGMQDDDYSVSYELSLTPTYEWVTEPNNLIGSDTGTFMNADILIPVTITGEVRKIVLPDPEWTVEVDVVNQITGSAAGYTIPSVQVTLDGAVVINSNTGGSHTAPEGGSLAIFNEDSLPSINMGYSFSTAPTTTVSFSGGNSFLPSTLTEDVVITITYTGAVDFNAMPGCNTEGAFNYEPGSDGSVACLFGPTTWSANSAEYLACAGATQPNLVTEITTVTGDDPRFIIISHVSWFGTPDRDRAGTFTVRNSRADVNIGFLRSLAGASGADTTIHGPATGRLSFTGTTVTGDPVSIVQEMSVSGVSTNVVNYDFNLEPGDYTYEVVLDPNINSLGYITGGVSQSIIIGSTELTLYTAGLTPAVGTEVYFTAPEFVIPSFTIPPGEPTVIPAITTPEQYFGETWISNDGVNVYRVEGGVITQGPIGCPVDYTNFFDTF